jgi:hypothetical protein
MSGTPASAVGPSSLITSRRAPSSPTAGGPTERPPLTATSACGGPGAGREADAALPDAHRVASLAKRWLLGTHQISADDAHLPS